MDYTSAVDIANRALQHCGATRITAFTDVSKNAASVSFVYDKVRRAELRRNYWTFAIRRTLLRPVDTTSVAFVPAAYSPTATYLNGSVVSYSGLIYQATQSVPAGNEPDTSPTYWTLYFGPMMITPWEASGSTTGPQLWNSSTSYAAGTQVVGSDQNLYASIGNGNLGNNPVNGGGVYWTLIGLAATGPGYYAGELVYIQSGATVSIYLSLEQGNTDVPGITPAWVASQSYNIGNTVTYGGSTYQSATTLNLGNTPTGTGAWVLIPGTQTDYMTGSHWLCLGQATFTGLNINYPVGCGPLSQEGTRNIFLLPNGYLREAPQDPKAGQNSWYGGPTGLTMTDWATENGYIVSTQSSVIPYRFVADVAYVGQFDAMFCEGLAARIAMEICEELTQSTEKLQAIEKKYALAMGEAREVAGIEQGPLQFREDDYISCRF